MYYPQPGDRAFSPAHILSYPILSFLVLFCFKSHSLSLSLTCPRPPKIETRLYRQQKNIVKHPRKKISSYLSLRLRSRAKPVAWSRRHGNKPNNLAKQAPSRGGPLEIERTGKEQGSVTHLFHFCTLCTFAPSVGWVGTCRTLGLALGVAHAGQRGGGLEGRNERN